MKFIVALLFSCIFLSAQARLGGLRGNPEGRRDQSHDDSIEVVITFEDDDEDDEDGQRTFKAMSSTFTRLSNDVEVHSMLRNIKMATARVKPAVSGSVVEKLWRTFCHLSAYSHFERTLNFLLTGCR